MKQRLVIVVCLFACLFMQLPVTVLADVSGSADAADELAQAIIDGRRGPLSVTELQSLSEQDKQRLAIALQRHRQERADQEINRDSSANTQLEKSQPSTVKKATITENDLPVLNKDKKAFIHDFAPLAKRVGQKFDLYPSIIIAQAILESSWGQSTLFRKYHNPMGVKGNGVWMPTLEQAGSQLCSVSADFRVYQSVVTALEDYGRIMQSALYNGCHRSQTANYQEATGNLKGRYATDANYDHKLNLLIKHYHLDDFDQQPKKQSQPKHVQPTAKSTRTYRATATPKHNDHPVQWQWPLAGGAGSLGILEIVRRLLK